MTSYVAAKIKTTLRAFLKSSQNSVRHVSVTVQGKETQYLYSVWDKKTTTFYTDDKCSQLNFALLDSDIFSSELRDVNCLELEYNAMEDNEKKEEGNSSWMTIELLDSGNENEGNIIPELEKFQSLREQLLKLPEISKQLKEFHFTDEELVIFNNPSHVRSVINDSLECRANAWKFLLRQKTALDFVITSNEIVLSCIDSIMASKSERRIQQNFSIMKEEMESIFSQYIFDHFVDEWGQLMSTIEKLLQKIKHILKNMPTETPTNLWKILKLGELGLLSYMDIGIAIMNMIFIPFRSDIYINSVFNARKRKLVYNLGALHSDLGNVYSTKGIVEMAGNDFKDKGIGTRKTMTSLTDMILDRKLGVDKNHLANVKKVLNKLLEQLKVFIEAINEAQLQMCKLS